MAEPTDRDERLTAGLSELDRLVDEYRAQCLWFLRADFYPRTAGEVLRVLHEIEIHGDVRAFQRAADIRRWLSRSSSENSAAS